MTRMDPREELRVLSESIEKKKKEISDLEDIVIKSAGLDTDSEREMVKAKLEEYDKVFGPYTAFLQSVGVTGVNISQGTQEHLQKLVDRSQKLKNQREGLTSTIAEMHTMIENRQTELRRGKRRELRKLKTEKEKLIALRDRLSKYRDEMLTANMWPDLRNYVNSLKEFPDDLHPVPMNTLNARVSAVLNQKRAERETLEKSVEKLRESCMTLKQRQEEIKTSNSVANKAYADSIEKKEEAEKRVAQAKAGIDAICDVIKTKSKVGNDLSCRISSAGGDNFDMLTSLSFRLDKLREKMSGYENPLDKIVIAEAPAAVSGEYSFRKPEDIVRYASMRKTVLSKVDPAEFKYFTYSEADLLKWYRITLDNYTKTKAEYETKRQQAKSTMSATEVMYNMLMRTKPKAK